MSMTDQETEQERAWGVLYDRIIEVLQQFGREDYCGRADYLLVDDNYGFDRHKMEVQNLNMFRPNVIRLLQQILGDFPNWEIVMAVDVPGTEGRWPRMGLTVRSNEIIDDLQRNVLPKEFENFRYS